MDATLLFPEAIFPVCSPDFLEQHPEITNTGDFLQSQLLDLRVERWDWVDWHQWLTNKNIPVPADIRIMGFNSLPLLIQAACQGQGVGLGWETLVQRYLDDGSLIRLSEEALVTGRGYYLLKRSGIRMSADTQTLFEWIVGQNK